MVITPSDAAALAEELLEALPQRWRHTQGVARAARSLAPLAGNNADLLETAAWLHDIGYSPALAQSGFHPLDGARHLSLMAAPMSLVTLVANHSNASVEAELRGLQDDLAEFIISDENVATLHPLLTYADMTTSPSGEQVCIVERLDEIYRRYPADHIVHRSIARAEQELLALTRSVDLRLKSSAPLRKDGDDQPTHRAFCSCHEHARHSE